MLEYGGSTVSSDGTHSKGEGELKRNFSMDFKVKSWYCGYSLWLEDRRVVGSQEVGFSLVNMELSNGKKITGPNPLGSLSHKRPA